MSDINDHLRLLERQEEELRRRNDELNKHKESIFSAADELMKKYPVRQPSQSSAIGTSYSDVPANGLGSLRSTLSLVDDEYDSILAAKNSSRPPTSRVANSQSSANINPQQSSQLPPRRPSAISVPPSGKPPASVPDLLKSSSKPGSIGASVASSNNPPGQGSSQVRAPSTRPDSALRRERPSSRPPSARPVSAVGGGTGDTTQTNLADASATELGGVGVGSETYDSPEDMPLDGVNAHAVIRFQKAKIQSLEATIASLTTQLKTQQQEKSKGSDKIRTLNEENVKLQKKLSACESVLSKYKQTANEAKLRVEELEKDAITQKKEIEKLVSLRTKMENDAKQQDSKLTRALVELEKAKSKTAETVVSKDKDSKVDVTRMEAENRRLLQQKNDLLTAMKKQYKLIAVLKKQIAHLEASRLIQFSEQDFVKAMQLE